FQLSWQERNCPSPHQATASANQMLTHKTSPSAADHRMAFQSERRDSWSLPPYQLKLIACLQSGPSNHSSLPFINASRILACASPSPTESYDRRGPVSSSTS